MTQAMTQDPSMVRAALLNQEPGTVVLGLAGTEYQLHLTVHEPVARGAGQRVKGWIRARAKRVDVIRSGGRYIEPVYGRPRRLQGSIVATDPSANTITVHCGCAFVCELTMNQRASDFAVGAMVSFDVERGAVFDAVKPA